MHNSLMICLLLTYTFGCRACQCQEPSCIPLPACVESTASAGEPICITLPNALCSVSPHCSYLQPQRVLIVTTHNRQDRLKENDLLAKSLAKHLRDGAVFDVVISRDKICRDKLPMQSGAFDERKLLQLSAAYHIDTVLFCEIADISAYEPMSMQASLLLVHVPEAVALVSANVSIDLGDAATNGAFHASAGVGRDPLELETRSSSPTQLIDYASQSIARGLLSIWR